MAKIFEIRVQKLFIIACFLKIGFSFLGWKFQDPWLLGFFAPLVIMLIYIFLGIKRRDNEVSDEKFADTCYYLGFIFTITSIIFSLFDLPQIGTRIQDISVRFGAAMISTVLGLTVRVYLVSFKKDAVDAIKDAENAILDATRKFTEQLLIVLERMGAFELQVDSATKSSVERVNIHLDEMSKDQSDKLTKFFSELIDRNQETLNATLMEVKSATQQLSKSVNEYSFEMQGNLASIEDRVILFTDAISDRLKTTTFPDDYFVKHLNEPLLQLKNSSSALAEAVSTSLREVNTTTALLSASMNNIRDMSSVTSNSLEAVQRLTSQQETVIDVARGQISALERVGNSLVLIDEKLDATIKRVDNSDAAVCNIVDALYKMVENSAENKKSFDGVLKSLEDNLRNQEQSSKVLVEAFKSNADSRQEQLESVIEKITSSVSDEKSELVKLGAVNGELLLALGLFNKNLLELQPVLDRVKSRNERVGAKLIDNSAVNSVEDGFFGVQG